MSEDTENVQAAPASAGMRLRRSLWAGVLPEGLGLCFVAVIFAGFAGAYLVAEHFWTEQSATVRQAEADTLAQIHAKMLGLVADKDEDAIQAVLGDLSDMPRVCAVRWTDPDGAARFEWPRRLGAVPGLDGAERDGELRPAAASVDIRTASGSAGTLRLELRPRNDANHHAYLIWNWGIAACLTLLVFAVVYRRLRRHLKPVAAIERNLHSYADGIEREFMTLMLSDSLGSIAQGWNRLIEELSSMKRELQNTAQSAQSQDVLARFESAGFRRVVDRLPFGILRVDASQSITYANASAAALLGRALDDVIGLPINDIIDDPTVTRALVGARSRATAGLSVDHTRTDGNEETTLRFRILPMAAKSPDSEALLTIEDIGQLRESQRARDEFLYHVTHELRTPLTNIHAYVETLTKPGFDDEQTRKECYNVIISETRRLSGLVENILSISQLEVGSARLDAGEVDLQRLIRQMVQDNLGAADEKRIDLTLALPPKVPKVSGDKQRLSVLLNNLIGNAIKYTPAEGKVQVKLDVTGQCIRIGVSDTGIGISPEDRQHVFDKFYRAASDSVQMVTGTGLGLAIAREVARLHGGEIHLESELGKGSTFTIELPLPSSDRTEVTGR